MKRPTFIFIAPTPEQKSRIDCACREVVDLLRQKYRMTIPECALTLDALVDGFEKAVDDSKVGP